MFLIKRYTRALLRLSVFTLFALVVGLAAPGTAAAAPPSNDDFGAAVAIGGLPFTTSVSSAEGTSATDDPASCFNSGSVWFSFTPERDMALQANTFGSGYDTVLSAFTGTRGALTLVPGACNDDFAGLQSRVAFAATGGTTYYFMVAQCCGSGGSGGGALTFSVDEVSVAANDNFANAAPVSLPFQQSTDTTGATVETGEPASSCGDVPTRSLWYSFTPASTGSVVATTSVASSVRLVVFRGSSLGSLTEVACRPFNGPVVFRAEAGQTYYLQLGDGAGSSAGPVQLSVTVAPPPEIGFSFSRSDPSVFDTVSFFDFSQDPAGGTITSLRWDFGDGGTATGSFPTHRYATDGDYPVTLTGTTADGRTASRTQTVKVATHDVSIDQFTVPRTARAGQSRPITVTVKNTRYNETVRVELYRSTPEGWVRFGELTQSVPARPDRTVNFPFSYTFTDDDAAIGKVSFRAVATFGNARDALPLDNDVVSTPTTVSAR